MPQAGGDAIFDFLQICRDGVKFILGIVPPSDPLASPVNRLPAIYRRIQAASPPPPRADKRPWEFGICIADGTENGRPFRPGDGDDSWKHQGVVFVEDIASLGQPDPGTIVLDQLLVVPAGPITWTFPQRVDQHGFRSASYPQPETGTDGMARVPVDYYAEYDLPWSRPIPAGSDWVAFSFDRFQPPERESVEFLARVEQDCDHRASPGGQEQAGKATSGSA